MYVTEDYTKLQVELVGLDGRVKPSLSLLKTMLSTSGGTTVLLIIILLWKNLD